MCASLVRACSLSAVGCPFLCRDFGTIVAIDTDPEAPIFDWADIGIVGDCATVLPALTEAFRRRRAQP